MTRRDLVDLLTITDQGQNLRLGDFRVIAQKIRRTLSFGHIKPNRRVRRFARAGPGCAGLRLLRRHRGVEPFGIHAKALFAQRILRQVEREAISVIKLERRLARQIRAVRQPRHFLIQQLQTPIQRLLEPGFFQLQRLFYQ